MTLQVQDHRSTLLTDPIRNFKFLAAIGVFVTDPAGNVQRIDYKMGFTSISGLSASVAPIPYRQGGYNTTVQQIPGQTTFSPVTFSRGQLLGNRQEWDWFRQLFAVQVGTGYTPSQGSFRANVEVYVLPHPDTSTANFDEVMVFKLYNAWPTAVSYSDLNAGDNAFIVSQMTLVHEGFEVGVATSPRGEHLSLPT